MTIEKAKKSTTYLRPIKYDGVTSNMKNARNHSGTLWAQFSQYIVFIMIIHF